MKTHLETSKKESKPTDSNDTDENSDENTNRGRMIYDATACPQDIAYPTDLNLLSVMRGRNPSS